MQKLILLVFIVSLLPFSAVKAELADHVVINEVQVAGETATDEYVKLYNSTNSEISLAGYRLTKITLSGSKYNLVTTFPEVKISAKSFLVISHKDFKGEKDLEYSSSSNSLADDNAVVLYNDSGKTEVDKVGYGKNTFGENQPAIAPAKNDPIIRKIDGEDTGENFNDFILKSSLNSSPVEEPAPEEEPEEPEQPEEIKLIKGVYINEIMPNPKSPEKDSDDEWFEIFNSTNVRIDLSGSIVRDGIGRVKEYVIPIGTFIESGEYLVFYSRDTRISLSNSGDFLELLDSGRNVIAKTDTYGKAKDDFSFSLFEEGWDWSRHSTPEEENVFEEVEEEKEVVVSEKAKKTKVKKPAKIKKPKLTKAKKLAKAKKPSTKKIKGAFVTKKDNEIAGVSDKMDQEIFNWDNKTKGKILIFLGVLIGINYLLFREKFYEIFKQKFFANG